MKDFQVDASLGSHFFHNITSMNIGYFTVPYSGNDALPLSFGEGRGGEVSFIDWRWLRNQKFQNKSEHFTHISFSKPFKVLMDGKKSISVIYKM